MFTWIPTYLKTERDLTIVGTSGYLFVVIAGAFLGYLTRGLGARPDRAPEGVRAVRGAGGHLAGRVLPGAVGLEHDAAAGRLPARVLRVRLLLGLRLLSRRSCSRPGHGPPARGFCYNVGRGFGALFPGIIGFLAAAVGLGGAIAFGVFGYVLAIAALTMLPETQGREIRAVE